MYSLDSLYLFFIAGVSALVLWHEYKKYEISIIHSDESVYAHKLFCDYMLRIKNEKSLEDVYLNYLAELIDVTTDKKLAVCLSKYYKDLTENNRSGSLANKGEAFLCPKLDENPGDVHQEGECANCALYYHKLTILPKQERKLFIDGFILFLISLSYEDFENGHYIRDYFKSKHNFKKFSRLDSRSEIVPYSCVKSFMLTHNMGNGTSSADPSQNRINRNAFSQKDI